MHLSIARPLAVGASVAALMVAAAGCGNSGEHAATPTKVPTAPGGPNPAGTSPTKGPGKAAPNPYQSQEKHAPAKAPLSTKTPAGPSS